MGLDANGWGCDPQLVGLNLSCPSPHNEDPTVRDAHCSLLNKPMRARVERTCHPAV